MTNQAEKIAELVHMVVKRHGGGWLVSAGVNVHGVTEVHVTPEYFDANFGDRTVELEDWPENLSHDYCESWTTPSGCKVFCLKTSVEAA